MIYFIEPLFNFQTDNYDDVDEVNAVAENNDEANREAAAAKNTHLNLLAILRMEC